MCLGCFGFRGCGFDGPCTDIHQQPPPTPPQNAPVLARIERQAAHGAGVLVGEVPTRIALVGVVLRGPQRVGRKARAAVGLVCWGIGCGFECWILL